MSLQFISSLLPMLTDLAKNFDQQKLQTLVSKLQSADSKELTALFDMIKPLAQGQLAPLLQQLTGQAQASSNTTNASENAHLNSPVVSQLQNVLSSVDSSDIQKLVGNFAGDKAMDMAKNVLGGLFK